MASMDKFSKQFFVECGRKGGSARSERKTNACRKNARKKRKNINNVH